MEGHRYYSTLLTLLVVVALTGGASGLDRWQAPFDSGTTVEVEDTALTLQVILNRVAQRSPLLKSLALRGEVARGRIIQAEIRPNPELESEIEEVGWDAPGFDESEMSLSLSQEFELFGQRGARRKVAEAEWQATEFQTRVAAFDLYLEVQSRYYQLAHAQEEFHLSDISVVLAEGIVETIEQRIAKGAGLQSELLLARLELQRARLAATEAITGVELSRIALASLWAGDTARFRVVEPAEPDFETVLSQISESTADSTRELLALDRYRAEVEAERRLAATEGKPNLTLRAGYKRLAADASNSLLFGIAMPLPFRNQNRGTLQSLDAELQQISLERQQAHLESRAAVASGVARLRQLNHRHVALDEELLPTAEEAYRTIETLYQTGRLPYTSLLEAVRSLVGLRFEHNDIWLTFRDQIIAIERLGGMILQADEDSDNE